MKFKKPKKSDILFLAIIIVLIVPQTRHPIQVALHSLLSKFSPSIIEKEDQTKVFYSSWKLGDLNGEEFNFIEAKGKVVFVNLWATWCPPCIAEFQTIQDLYNDYKDDVVFLLISDESSATIKKFLERKGYNIQVFNPSTNYPTSFNPRSIPRTYIIDKKGSIVVDKKGAANWNSKKIRDLIEQLISVKK